MQKNESKPASRKNDIVIQEYKNEILIYDLTAHKAFSLNETSALVWQACDGNKTISEIADLISRRLKSRVTEDFVWLALEELKKENLIENSTEISAPFEGLTRREVIRRVGLASLVALPIISTLIAPTAAHAQSGFCAAGNCRCSNGSTSCNGTTGTFGGVSYINCRTISGGNPNCNCVGPFNAANSAGSGFQSSQTGCRIS